MKDNRTNKEKEESPIVEYHSEQYNKFNDTEQWIRLSDGCFRNCWNCYAPKKKIFYDLPEIVRNKVIIMDMNFLWAYPNPLETIKKLGEKRVNGKVVYYDFLCGLDYGLLTNELAEALHKYRFGHFNSKRNFIKGLRIAWDRSFDEQMIIKKCMDMLRKAGYSMKATQIFMLVNGKVPYSECVMKLNLLKVWNVQVSDCWYDNQIRGSVIPKYWNDQECKDFGRMCRKHNQLVNFGVDPEWKSRGESMKNSSTDKGKEKRPIIKELSELNDLLLAIYDAMHDFDSKLFKLREKYDLV